MGERTRSFLKIQDGCDYNCSYCTIPLARGRSRSSNISKTLSQAIKIGKTDIKEIVLTGVNVGDFGVNRNENLYNLIQEMEKIDGINRYRISSIEPNLITDEIINFTAISNKFLPHYHIPLQSGSDAILKAMRRRYNTKLYADRIQKIKSIMPYACIGVDVIVGFPGESDDHFQQTYDLLDGLDISYLHVFSYSMRNNTEAVLMNNKVPQDIISERSKMLHRLSIVKKRNFWENNIESVKQVLIENFEEGFLYGHSENYIPVRILGKRNEVNEIIPVKFIQIEDGAMIGERQI
jgi:threonylcarbamoyladenosine tRNA methylthiotransferase MtaB